MLSIRYLHDAPMIKTPGLSLRGVGVHETMPASVIERPAGTGDRLFMLFYDDFDFGPPGKRQRVAGPAIVFWPSGAAHHYGNPRRPWQHSWIHCDGSVITRQIAAAGLVEGKPLPLADPSTLDGHFLAIYEESTVGDAVDVVILRNLIENLIREAVRGRRPPRRVPSEQLVRVKRYIDTHYEQRVTLTDLARLADLSRGHLCTEFRRHYGTTPLAYLIHRRLHAAASLLRGTAEPVGEIGRRVGYSDPYYFSKHFKACFGVPPSRLRESSP